MERFPFDRHTLDIAVGETQHDARFLVYSSDAKDSGIAPEIQLTDWYISKRELVTRPYPYKSRFGDPSLAQPHSDWAEAHLITRITRRHRGTSFFKLTFTAYVAFALLLLSFLMESAIFSSRISLLIGSLFATVVNMRTSGAALGANADYTLVDKVHLLVIAFIVAGTAITVGTYYLERKQPRIGRASDVAAAVLFAMVFVILNVFIVASAVRG